MSETLDLTCNEDAFGFLWDASRSAPPRLSTQALKIEPLDDYAERKACFDACLVSNGSMTVLYPPIIVTQRESDGTRVTVPRTERPADMYFPTISHRLIFPAGYDSRSMRKTESLFVLQFLAYLYDTRLQFWDWQLDTRVIITPKNSSIFVADAEPLIVKALTRYRSLDPQRQLLLTNMLYLNSRAWHLFWEWERFWQEFLVFDSVRVFLADLSKPDWQKTKPSWQKAVEQLGVRYDRGRICRMKTLRNEFFHQGLWSGDIPGFAVSDLPITELRALNERLIAGLLCIGSSFRGSVWWDQQINELKDN
jgi:hypothetical protein